MADDHQISIALRITCFFDMALVNREKYYNIIKTLQEEMRRAFCLQLLQEVVIWPNSTIDGKVFP